MGRLVQATVVATNTPLFDNSHIKAELRVMRDHRPE